MKIEASKPVQSVPQAAPVNYAKPVKIVSAIAMIAGLVVGMAGFGPGWFVVCFAGFLGFVVGRFME